MNSLDVFKEWRVGGAGIKGMLAEAEGEFTTLRRVIGRFFAEESTGKEYTRRPHLSVRLPARETPPAWVAIVPSWDRRKKRLDPHDIRLELLVARIDYGGRQPSVELAVNLDDRGAHLYRHSTEWGTEGTRRLIDTITAFLRDPDDTFASASDRCGICGRRLTDEVSRARGVGPECLSRANRLRALVERLRREERTEPLESLGVTIL